MEAVKIAIAMSGGVDSSVAAALLKESGYDLVGFSMQLWDQKRGAPDGDSFRSGRCCSLDDLYDAREVAARLGIPYYVVNFQKEFELMVVRTFVEDYIHGLTPSPCVLCNSQMKFDQLLRMAEEIRRKRWRPAITPAFQLMKRADGFSWGRLATRIKTNPTSFSS